MKKSPPKKAKTRVVKTQIEKLYEFAFVYEENAMRVSWALSRAGFYIKVRKDGPFIVEIFSNRI